MKYLKMAGLAAVAIAAFMAFGANTASATTACTATETPCSTANEISNLHDSHLQAKIINTAILETGGSTVIAKCTVGSATGTAENTGSASETLKVELTSLTWGAKGAGCDQTVNTIKPGTLEIHHISGTHNGTVTANGAEVTVELFGVSCAYASGTGLHLGTITGGVDPILDISTKVKKSAGGFLCPAEAQWTAEYTIETPKPLYIEP